MPAEADRVLSIAFWQDVGPGSAFSDEGAQGVGFVALVGHQHRTGSEMADQVSGAGDVAGLPHCQLELDRAPLRIEEGMDFGGEPTSGATETTISLPPLSGRTLLVDPHDRGVDHLDASVASLCDRVHQTIPDVGFASAVGRAAQGPRTREP